jgi:hypothetical protein
MTPVGKRLLRNFLKSTNPAKAGTPAAAREEN